jgi:hypothetical protein
MAVIKSQEVHDVDGSVVRVVRFEPPYEDDLLVYVDGERYEVFFEDGAWRYQTEGGEREGSYTTADKLIQECFLDPEGP